MNAQTQITDNINLVEDEIVAIAKDLQKNAKLLDKKTADANAIRDELRSTRADIQAAMLAEDDNLLMDLTKNLKGLNNRLDRAIEAYNDAEAAHKESLTAIRLVIKGIA